jgi:multidrug transporter EmrE-like cation transporter
VLLVVTSYSIGVLLWLPAAIHQKNHLSIASTIWPVVALTMTVLIGLFLFNGHLSLVN